MREVVERRCGSGVAPAWRRLFERVAVPLEGEWEAQAGAEREKGIRRPSSTCLSSSSSALTSTTRLRGEERPQTPSLVLSAHRVAPRSAARGGRRDVPTLRQSLLLLTDLTSRPEAPTGGSYARTVSRETRPATEWPPQPLHPATAAPPPLPLSLPAAPPLALHQSQHPTPPVLSATLPLFPPSRRQHSKAGTRSAAGSSLLPPQRGTNGPSSIRRRQESFTTPFVLARRAGGTPRCGKGDSLASSVRDEGRRRCRSRVRSSGSGMNWRGSNCCFVGEARRGE